MSEHGNSQNLLSTGSTEAEAKLDALQKAWRTLPLLFGYKDLPTEDPEAQINRLLKSADQQPLTFSFKPHQHKITLMLRYQDYTMASKSQRTKKENRNLLSKRILGLLGAETGQNVNDEFSQIW